MTYDPDDIFPCRLNPGMLVTEVGIFFRVLQRHPARAQLGPTISVCF